jgi:hypothetical protein
MAEIVNLRTVRKRKARAEREAGAVENRARHGRSKADKERDRAAQEKHRDFIEGHFRRRPDPER